MLQHLLVVLEDDGIIASRLVLAVAKQRQGLLASIRFGPIDSSDVHAHPASCGHAIPPIECMWQCHSR
jgi:hypothetical protein